MPTDPVAPADGAPLAIAHQGGAAEAPSSTMFAFARAVARGMDVLELDVHATADRRLVVIHDDTVDRTTDGSGQVAHLTLAQLQRLDAAHWFVPGRGTVHGLPDEAYPLRGVATGTRPAPDDLAGADLAIPTLDDVLAAFRSVSVNIDIKQTVPQVEPYEQLIADCVRRAGRVRDVVVASFSDVALSRFRTTAPEIATSAGPLEARAFWSYAHGSGPSPEPVQYRALQVPEVFGDLQVVTEELVRTAHDHGLPVHVWTVDDEPSMHRLLDLGVDGIVTDRPTVLLRVLRERRGD